MTQNATIYLKKVIMTRQWRDQILLKRIGFKIKLLNTQRGKGIRKKTS